MTTKEINITLNEAKEMFAAGGNLAQLALSVYSEADINPNYEPPVDEENKYNIKTDLPVSWDGAVSILGSLTRCGYIMSTGTGNPSKSDEIGYESNWADHVYVPPVMEIFDTLVPHAYVHLSNILVNMGAWWIVDNDWEPDFKNKKQEKYAIRISNDGKVNVEKLGPKERALVCFSTKELAEKFKNTFPDLIWEARPFIY